MASTKKLSLTFYIELSALVSILLANICRADAGLQIIDSVLQFEITTDATRIKINPDGPLNFLRGYIYQKMDCMHNKRFFAPQIDTEYSASEDPKYPDFFRISRYSRDIKKDKAYKALPENEMDVFSEKLHTHLIKLFPSPTGDITIETRGNQSFIQFLQAETTTEHALKILAMLLLFSEGVDIPIRVSNNVLEVYEKEKKDEIYFKVPMVISWLNIKEDKVETFQQSKVKQMISFFKEYATNLEVLSLMVDKCSKEEVMSGKFLDSPKFLIQYYIFEFINTAEHAIEFIQTVHAMTEKYAPKTEAPSKDDCVYDRLFKPAIAEAEVDCAALMKDTQDILNTYLAFPFADNTQLPAYRSVPLYNRESASFSSNYLENYSNCVECVILSLFCCLAYNPEERIYQTDHMGDISPSLKEFFCMDMQQFDTTAGEFQEKWCRVVAGLENVNIVYLRDKNEIYSGLLNILTVIAEIVNAPEDEKNKIANAICDLYKQNGYLTSTLHENIKDYTENLLKRLSKTKDTEVEVSLLDAFKDDYHENLYDISGVITMVFKHYGVLNTITLKVGKEHSEIEMEPTVIKVHDNRLERMNRMADTYRDRKKFIENLLTMYVEYEARKIDTPENSNEFMRSQVCKTIENNFTDINRLLLMKKISDYNYKQDLVACSIIYSMDQKLFLKHPLVRFTSNIIGSTELNRMLVQMDMLAPIVFADLHNKDGKVGAYPRLQFSENRYKQLAYFSFTSYFINYTLYNDAVFMVWIKSFRYTCMKDEVETRSHPLTVNRFNRRICQYIFRNGDMKLSNIIDRFITDAYPAQVDEVTPLLHFIWTVYLCAEENPNVQLIKANYDYMCDSKHISKDSASFVLLDDIREQVVKTLNDLKDHLCRNEDDVNELNKFILIIQKKA
ncbi:uncharacterized protein NESG_00992 [Nematocida ausubeli]|uniref:Uncharacterized protein n=1 Tax=Nematocida ausubeli (strain ATCC PRA-371 / ERTm2) TaxID=1913371 RepID=A0A086J3W8_NEMA1|nr:uncharacterized protein NESG_00992 [Nematocida ausubeli]KFG26836.1 hypothetical protein NESG_00992 [Nematocida ausubeli]